jgi:hypothetical protein
MNLANVILLKLGAYVADYGNRPGDANAVAEAFKAYDSLVQDMDRGASADTISQNKLFQKRAKNSSVRVA